MKKLTKLTAVDNKFKIEFDKVPSLVFVQRSNKLGDFDIYQDGEVVEGVRYVDIEAGYDSQTTHRVEYATGFTQRLENEDE